MFGYICAAINFTTNTIIGIAMIAVAALIIVLMRSEERRVGKECL